MNYSHMSGMFVNYFCCRTQHKADNQISWNAKVCSQLARVFECFAKLAAPLAKFCNLVFYVPGSGHVLLLGLSFDMQ